MAEEYIGVVSCKDSDDPKLARLKNFRSLRNRHFDSVLRKDSVEKEIEELETKDAVQKVVMKAREFFTSEEFLAQKFDTPQLQELKEKVKYEIREVNHWKRAIISQHEAEEKAKLEYMTPSEREIWQKYFEMLNQKKQLAKFVEEHTNPDSKDGKMEEVVTGAKAQIFAILSSAVLLKPSIKEIKKKLETPDCRKNILLVTHQILQANSLARKILKLESEKLDRAVDDLKAEIFYQSISEKEYYKTREIYNILRRQYFELKKEYEKQLEVRYSYQKKVISTSRAMEMAKNIFVKGDLKKLRASLRKLQKDREKLAKNLEAFHQHEEKLKSTKITADNQAELWQEKYLLTKKKMSLELEKKRLEDLKIFLEKEKVKLEEICNSPESVRQIQLIAAAILRKNHKFVEKVSETTKKIQDISSRLKRTKTQMDVMEIQLKSERRTTFYQVLEPKYSDKRATALIADAFLGDSHAAQLVARSSSNNLEMEKDWELMSDLDKDELLHKQIFRDL